MKKIIILMLAVIVLCGLCRCSETPAARIPEMPQETSADTSLNSTPKVLELGAFEAQITEAKITTNFGCGYCIHVEWTDDGQGLEYVVCYQKEGSDTVKSYKVPDRRNTYAYIDIPDPDYSYDVFVQYCFTWDGSVAATTPTITAPAYTSE